MKVDSGMANTNQHDATPFLLWKRSLGTAALVAMVGVPWLLMAGWSSSTTTVAPPAATTTTTIISPHNLRHSSPVPRFLQDTECTRTCCVEAYSDLPCKEEEESTADNPFANTPLWFQITLMCLLIIMSAFFSGLTLGLMGLDKTGLEIVMEGDDEKYREMAKKIYPLRKQGNLLLCTLLLGNVCVNSLLSILTADKFGGTIGLLSSTFLIVIFGEIVPQASCQRYSLEVGSAMVPVVRVIMYLLLPVSFLLAKGLDYALGEELATTYSSKEMIKLLQIHVQEEMIDPDTAKAMQGAIQFKDMTVKEVMTPLANTFMLSVDDKLNFETIAKIFKTGYSRIPVYQVTKNNVIGLLFVKDLIFIDPEDDTRVQDFVDIFGRRVHTVWPDDKLGDVLRDLKQGKSHMALVQDVNNEDESKDPFYEVKGIITLEDIIEEIIGVEIVDETDEYVDGTHSVPVDRGETFKWASLRLLDSKIVDETLSYDETQAVTAHLLRNYYDVVSLLTEHQLEHLIATTPVSVLPTATEELGKLLPDDLLYEKNKPNDTCTLILSGKVKVLAGADNFRTDVSSWSVLASKALADKAYAPDFSAYVSSGPCRCLRLTRARFLAAVDASTVERQAHATPTGSPVVSVGHKDSASSSGHNGKSRKQKLMTALKAVEVQKKVASESVVGRRAIKAAAITGHNHFRQQSSEKLEPVVEAPSVPTHVDGETTSTPSHDDVVSVPSHEGDSGTTTAPAAPGPDEASSPPPPPKDSQPDTDDTPKQP
uniref:CNNM transmembrane domain-containing protein n=1 Tax=Amphora coffeiformis TaxID=265554 RepID=A0A7S3LGG6_9STRA